MISPASHDAGLFVGQNYAALYFTTAEHGLVAIRDQRLKVAEIDKLNDPFEFLGLNLSDQLTRKQMKKIKKGIGEEKGIICLSKSWKHPLMWSHYADKHKGLCLGFDVHCKAEKVEYVGERLTPDILGADSLFNLTVRQVTDSLFYKFEAWRYEAEYRLICSKKYQDAVTKLYFQHYGEDLTLKEVIVGCESTLSQWQLQQVLGSAAETVETFKVRPAFKKFEIVRDRRQNALK